MNSIMVIGQLGREPILKQSQNGKTYMQNSIYEYMGRDESGNPTYQWRDFVAYGATAEAIARNGFHRGRLAIVGREDLKIYTDRNGNEKLKAEISVMKADFIDFEKPKPEAPKSDDFIPQGFTEIADDIPF